MLAITNLPRQTEDEIRHLVESGDFDNGTDVVVQAVHDYVTRRNKAHHLRELLQVGLDAADRGELVDFTPGLMRQIREDARRLAAAGEPLDPDVCG